MHGGCAGTSLSKGLPEYFSGACVYRLAVHGGTVALNDLKANIYIYIYKVRPGSSTAALACGGCAVVMRFENGEGRDDGRLRASAVRFAE